MAKRSLHHRNRNRRNRNLLAEHELGANATTDVAASVCKSCGASISTRRVNNMDGELLCKACEARWNVSLASPFGDSLSTLILSAVCFALSSLIVPALIFILKWAGGVPQVLRGKAAFIWISPLLFGAGRWLANFLVAKMKLKPGTMWAECATAFIAIGGFGGSYAALKWLAPDSINLGWTLVYCVAPLALGFLLETRRWERFATV